MIIHKSPATATNDKHGLFNEHTVTTPGSSYTISEHDPVPLKSTRNSYTRPTIYHHDPGPRSMNNASLTRSTIFHHDPGPKSMINASSTRPMLFPYDPGPKDRPPLLNKNTVTTSGSSYTTSEHDPGPPNSQRNSCTRPTIYHHDSGPRSMINASPTRLMLIPYDPDPDNLRFRSRMITIEDYIHGFDQIPSRRQLKKIIAEIQTMYKRKDRKIRPVNTPLPDEIKTEGGVNPGVNSEANMTGKPSENVPRGSRLTPEGLASMKIDTGFLSNAEKQLFVDILFKYESAIAFDDSEMGLLRSEIEPPAVIHTVPHVPWQQQNIRLPFAMKEAATRIVKEKLAKGLLEPSQGPYRNRYFLVTKKLMDWRFINDVQLLNKITIRDSGMPPSVDEFSEDFAGYPITSAVDYYSGYDQISLDKRSRDLTVFLTEIGLLRNTRLPQGWTNSVAYFQRIMAKVHYRQIPHEVHPFLDDCGIKESKSRYDDAEISP